MNKTTLEDISSENSGDLSKVYKEVFKGNPWYEDRVCSGILLPEGNPERCTVQYTSSRTASREASLDRAGRKGLVGSTSFEETTRCLVCEKKLIEFYPEYVDQSVLIGEAREKEGYQGLLAKKEGVLAGFCWGYAVPLKATQSVDFPKAIPYMCAQGIEPEKTFYWAEVGVVEKFQLQGLGKLLTETLITNIIEHGYAYLALRTKNPAVNKILENIFQNEESIQPAFNDPIRGTAWYLLNISQAKCRK